MTLELSQALLTQIHAHAEAAYPEEGAGFLLGKDDGERRQVMTLLELANAREGAARHNRYLLAPQDYLQSEEQAAWVWTCWVCSILTQTIPTGLPSSTASGPCPGSLM
jgi:proteasome lid subunit RPN8/RPN11